MRTSLGLATFLALGMGTVAVGAKIGPGAAENTLVGSDTLKDITTQVITATACTGDDNGITYVGGGSSNGQSEAGNNNQQIAPMSRKVNSSTANGCGVAAIAAVAEGIVIGLDGLSMIAAAPVAALCSANPVGGEDCNQATDPATGLAYSRTFDTALSCDTGGAPDEAKCDVVDAALYTCNAATLKCSYTLGAGLAGTANDWQDALRLIYGGVDANDGNTLANRDCDSPARVALANNWGNIFEGSCGTGCTQLQHAFRRDDESGTTDTFVSALGLPSIALNNGVAECNNTSGVGPGCVSQSPFCNALWKDKDDVTLLACAKDADCFGFDCNETSLTCRTARVPYYSDMQDNDRIRRPCVGNGNLPGPPTGTLGNPPLNEPTEQICNRDGTLGLVLPIQPPGYGPTSTTDIYPEKDCARGRFFNGAVSVVTAGPPTVRDRCPNGDTTFFGGCLTPMALDGDASCISGKNNLPAFKVDPANAVATDGRVYNRIVRKGGLAGDKGTMPTIVRNTKNADVVNAYYKIHTTRSLAAAPGLKNTCDVETDATSQLGCLTIASQCSISFAGNSGASASIPNNDLLRAPCNANADCGTGGTCVAKCFGDLAACTDITTQGGCALPADKPAAYAASLCGVCQYAAEGAAALEVAALEPSDVCVRKLLPGSVGTPYPIARKLYVNSLDGFQTLPGTTQPSTKSELALAQCFSNDAAIHTIVKNVGFITIGDVTAQPGACANAASVFCENQCSSGGSLCADNGPAGITTRAAPVDLAAGWVPDDTNACP